MPARQSSFGDSIRLQQQRSLTDTAIQDTRYQANNAPSRVRIRIHYHFGEQIPARTIWSSRGFLTSSRRSSDKISLVGCRVANLVSAYRVRVRVSVRWRPHSGAPRQTGCCRHRHLLFLPSPSKPTWAAQLAYGDAFFARRRSLLATDSTTGPRHPRDDCTGMDSYYWYGQSVLSGEHFSHSD